MNTYHFTVNGVPACAAIETMDLPLGSCTSCAHDSEESAQADIDKVLAVHPEALCEIVSGHCPRPLVTPSPYDY